MSEYKPPGMVAVGEPKAQYEIAEGEFPDADTSPILILAPAVGLAIIGLVLGIVVPEMRPAILLALFLASLGTLVWWSLRCEDREDREFVRKTGRRPFDGL